MKSVAARLRIFLRNPPLNLSSPLPIRELKVSATATTTTNSSASLTNDEVKQINAVVPRLCSSSHLKEAIHLISAALSTENPPLCSLPLSTVVKRLAVEPDLTLPMHLLNTLKYNPSTGNPVVLLPIAKMFVSSFFQKGHPKRAVKVFQWVSRLDLPGESTLYSDFYAAVVVGFCGNGMVLDSLRVLRVMASENLVIRSEIRVWVYRGLLRDARVREALELNAALGSCTLGSDGGTSGSKEVVGLLDRMIANWVE